MSEEQQLARQLENRWWRLSHLYWVQNAHGQKVKFKPNWAQKALFASFWFLNVVLKVRQIGISTFAAVVMLDRCLFNKDQTCGIIDRTDPEAVKKLAKIEYAYDHLDDPDDPQTAPLGKLVKQAVQRTKKNDHEHEFSNGSKIWCGVTLRGGTINFLWVSEMGTIAHKDPHRADEIASGSFNTVHAGNWILVESTHEGGRYGLNYELIRQAQKCPPQPTPLDWRFHFFPWYLHPEYRLELVGPFEFTKDELAYFDRLEQLTGVKLDAEQRHWWAKKSRSPRVDMSRQYPGTAEEALSAMAEGAIYGPEMVRLRAAGRVRDFPMDGQAPIFVFADIGQSDFVALWFLQMVGLDILLLGYHTGQGETPAETWAAVLEWERVFGRPVKTLFLPHDANNRSSVGITFVDALRAAGCVSIKVVPRTPDVWIGIKHLKSLLPRCIIHATRCGKEREIGHRILPSGIACLEGYHRKVEAVDGRIQEQPVHDASSHGCDALRTFAEAHHRGMLDGLTRAESKLKRHSAAWATGLRTTSIFSASDRLGKTGLVRQ